MIRSFGHSWESGRTATGASARDGGARTGREAGTPDFEARAGRGRADEAAGGGVGTGDGADAADFPFRAGRGAGVNARIN